MATITRRIDKSVESGKRYVYLASSENADDGTAIAADDIFMIQDSLGRPASYIYIETTSGTDLTVRLNSQVVQYKLMDERLNGPVPRYDLANPVERTETSLPVITVGADEVWELKNALPVSDIQIVTFSAGSFEIFVA